MFNPQLCSKNEVNQTQAAELSPRPLFSHNQDGYKYFSFMKLCKEILNSDLSFTQFQELFFHVDLLSERAASPSLTCIPPSFFSISVNPSYLFIIYPRL